MWAPVSKERAGRLPFDTLRRVAPRDFRTRLNRRASKAGLFLAEDLSARLTAYYELLSRWNRKINLTSIVDPDDAIDRLLLEPLLAARHVPPDVSHLLDVGSGGGSPGIPLKLALPRVALTMVEVKIRKSAFLREAVRHLELRGVTVEAGRYEELLARPELHETFDVVSQGRRSSHSREPNAHAASRQLAALFCCG